MWCEVSEYPDVLTVDGVRFSRAIFKYFAEQANVDSMFRFVKLEDGLVTVEKVASKQRVAAIGGPVGVNTDSVRATGRALLASVAPSAGTPSDNTSLESICPQLQHTCWINGDRCTGKKGSCSKW